MIYLEKKAKPGSRSLELARAVTDALEDLIDQEERCSEKIKHSDLAVKGFYETDEDCKRIDTIPGFGVFLSVLSKVEIGTIDRFKSASRLCSYAGLVPSTYSSGGKTRHGKIIKAGNRNLRWCLVEAAIHSLKDRGDIRAFYLRIRRKKGSKVARVATARKLCCVLYRILSHEDTYKVYRTKKQSRLGLASGAST